MSSNYAEPLYIVYDGDCPLCSRYVQFLRLKQSVGQVHLVNARDPGAHAPVINNLVERGYDLNEGMALVQGGHVAHGRDCINHIALLSTGSGLFNKLNTRIFASPARAKAFYPLMRTGRNLLLAVLGRRKINSAKARTN